eukprot:COSAG05_NODE_2583_length_2873_cov_359.798116_3_plen_91_part_00
MSSSRASVSQLDSLMAGIVGSSDLFASAAASAMGTTTAAEGAAFQRAVNDNMEALDLKMAFEVFKTESGCKVRIMNSQWTEILKTCTYYL